MSRDIDVEHALVDLAEDDDAGKGGFGVIWDRRVEKEDSWNNRFDPA